MAFAFKQNEHLKALEIEFKERSDIEAVAFAYLRNKMSADKESKLILCHVISSMLKSKSKKSRLGFEKSVLKSILYPMCFYMSPEFLKTYAKVVSNSR
jgi:hypothetical protein